jgi:hypothetical protein
MACPTSSCSSPSCAAPVFKMEDSVKIAETSNPTPIASQSALDKHRIDVEKVALQNAMAAAKIRRRKQKDCNSMTRGGMIVLLAVSIYVFQTSWSWIEYANMRPLSTQCSIISTTDRFYLCSSKDFHFECQESLVSFNITFEGQTSIATEKVVFKPRLTRTPSTQIECFYLPRANPAERIFTLNRDNIRIPHFIELCGGMGLMFSVITSAVALVLMIKPDC